MRTKSIVLACVIFGLAIGTALADDFWTKKDSTQWSKGDCNKILQNSPWGKTGRVENSSSAGSAPSVSQDARDGNLGMSGQGTGSLEYYISMYSAPPVRMALVRKAELDKKFDKKPDAERQEFDKKFEADLPKFKDDEIAFHVGYYSPKLNLEQDISHFWQQLIPQGSVPDGTFLLTEDGRKVVPETYQPGKEIGEFYVTFPRTDGGKPTIAEGAKTIKVQVTSPQVGDFSASKVIVEFKLDQIKWQDKATY